MVLTDRAEEILETLWTKIIENKKEKGKPIPKGRCCKGIKKTPRKLIMPLTELRKNINVKVSYLQTRNRSALQKMIAMGILPDTKISLIQKFPSYVLQIGKSQFAIDKELAGNVYVRTI
jgi:DtxR family Mn-dependent transcriptional regulator